MEFTEVLRAANTLAAHLPATPMWSYPELDTVTGAHVYVKHEHVQPTGAFKVRGGLTLLAGLDGAQRARGIVGYSTGNHAQSLAYAAWHFDVACRIVMPADPNPTKLRAVTALGATVDCRGATLEESRAYAEQLAERHGMRLVSPADEPALIAGVGTAYLEVLSAQPELDAIVVPVGGGSGAAAACLVAAAQAPGCRIIAVQSDAAPAAHDSWRAGRCVARPNRTRVEGLATGSGFDLTQRLMRGLADFVLVGDAQIAAAQRVLFASAHTLAEGAGAAALAAVLADPASFAGQRVAIMCTGGNAGPAELARMTEPAA